MTKAPFVKPLKWRKSLKLRSNRIKTRSFSSNFWKDTREDRWFSRIDSSSSWLTVVRENSNKIYWSESFRTMTGQKSSSILKTNFSHINCDRKHKSFLYILFAPRSSNDLEDSLSMTRMCISTVNKRLQHHYHEIRKTVFLRSSILFESKRNHHKSGWIFQL